MGVFPTWIQTPTCVNIWQVAVRDSPISGDSSRESSAVRIFWLKRNFVPSSLFPVFCSLLFSFSSPTFHGLLPPTFTPTLGHHHSFHHFLSYINLARFIHPLRVSSCLFACLRTDIAPCRRTATAAGSNMSAAGRTLPSINLVSREHGKQGGNVMMISSNLSFPSRYCTQVPWCGPSAPLIAAVR